MCARAWTRCSSADAGGPSAGPSVCPSPGLPTCPTNSANSCDSRSDSASSFTDGVGDHAEQPANEPRYGERDRNDSTQFVYALAGPKGVGKAKALSDRGA